MKKVLTVLLTAAMCAIAPAAIFAETPEPDPTINEFTPETDTTQVDGSVDLEAEIVSTYTVKLPKVIDVNSESTTVDIFAKGDVDGSKKIVISEKNAGSNSLADLSGKNQAKALTIGFGTGIEGKNILADYSTAKEVMTIAHSKLVAGSWKCNLPILIKLEDVSKS